MPEIIIEFYDLLPKGKGGRYCNGVCLSVHVILLHKVAFTHGSVSLKDCQIQSPEFFSLIFAINISCTQKVTADKEGM